MKQHRHVRRIIRKRRVSRQRAMNELRLQQWRSAELALLTPAVIASTPPAVILPAPPWLPSVIAALIAMLIAMLGVIA